MPSDAKGPLVLIVEDDKFLSKIFQTKLSKEGFNIALAGNGKQALELAKKQKPALILLDLIMPVMSGFETLEALKADAELNDVPVIVLSNLGQESDIQKAKELGAVDFMIKANVAIQEVVKIIRTHLG